MTSLVAQNGELIPQGVELRAIDGLKTLLDEPSAEAALEFVKTQDLRLADLMKFQGVINRVTAITLYTMRRAWDHLGEEGAWRLWKQNPWCPEDDFNYSFEQYAQRRTGYKWTTLNNMIRTARLWFVRDNHVEIPERVEAVDPKTGERTGEIVEFNVWDVDSSKLYLCNSKLLRGEMTEEDWGVLANPKSTFNDVWKNVVRSDEPDGPRGFYLYLEGGLLFAAETGFEPVAVGELFVDDDSDLVQKGLDRLIRRADIVVRG